MWDSMWHTDDYSPRVEIAIRRRERERETRNIPQKHIFPYAQLPADVSFFFSLFLRTRDFSHEYKSRLISPIKRENPTQVE